MMSDAIALFIALYGIKMANRGSHEKWNNLQNTFGWGRSEVIATLANAVFLMALCLRFFFFEILRKNLFEIFFLSIFFLQNFQKKNLPIPHRRRHRPPSNTRKSRTTQIRLLRRPRWFYRQRLWSNLTTRRSRSQSWRG